ncbi:hypothetical protein Ahy_A01g003886 [Arachis hypogaea]|uniref:CHCH domain-containing protein n=1 Tax=Arachis hypogaea TaxID=3818 RepID=A0A445EUF0_ARAHY|nr:hypothetical protein Ahy_A01g003886 [Arachis hypogaea]
MDSHFRSVWANSRNLGFFGLPSPAIHQLIINTHQPARAHRRRRNLTDRGCRLRTSLPLTLFSSPWNLCSELFSLPSRTAPARLSSPRRNELCSRRLSLQALSLSLRGHCQRRVPPSSLCHRRSSLGVSPVGHFFFMPLSSLRTELPRSTQYSPNSTSLQNSSLSDSDSAKPFPFLQMSAGGAFGGNRGLRPVPPEKGIFPLDHMHLCDLEKKEYLGCLKTAGHQSEKCRDFSKKYLQCRMEKSLATWEIFAENFTKERWNLTSHNPKNLMAKQDLAELGFKERNGETPEGKPTERIDNLKDQ